MKNGSKAIISLVALLTLAGCDNSNAHTHKYGNIVPKVDATCENQGLKEHYYCESCKTYFDNEYFEVNYENLVIPKLDHVHNEFGYDNETHYKECENGCHEKFEVDSHKSTGILYFNETHHWNQCECGFVMNKESHDEVGGNFFHSDGINYHYRVCSCGQILDKGTHIFNTEIENEEYLDEESLMCGNKPRYFKSCICGAFGTETFESKTKPVITHNFEKGHDTSKHYDECTICHVKQNEVSHSYTTKVMDAGDFRGYELKTCNGCEYEYYPEVTHTIFDNYVNSLTSKGVNGNGAFDKRALDAGTSLYNKLSSSEQTQVTKKTTLDGYISTYNSKYQVAYDMYYGNSKFTTVDSAQYHMDLANHDDPTVGRYMEVEVLNDDANEPTTGNATLDKIGRWQFNHTNTNTVSFTPKAVILAIEAPYNPRFISFTSCNWAFLSGTNIPGTNWYTYRLEGEPLEKYMFQYGRENCAYRFGKYENNMWSLPTDTYKVSNFVFVK